MIIGYRLPQPYTYECVHVNHNKCKRGYLWCIESKDARLILKCDYCDDIDPNQYELKI